MITSSKDITLNIDGDDIKTLRDICGIARHHLNGLDDRPVSFDVPTLREKIAEILGATG